MATPKKTTGSKPKTTPSAKPVRTRASKPRAKPEPKPEVTPVAKPKATPVKAEPAEKAKPVRAEEPVESATPVVKTAKPGVHRRIELVKVRCLVTQRVRYGDKRIHLIKGKDIKLPREIAESFKRGGRVH